MGWKRIDPIAPVLQRKAISQAIAAVDDTTAAAAIFAKQNHPGWQNRTGTLEGSVRMEPATVQGNRIHGLFGSFDVNYAIYVEVLHGRFLRNAADAEFPKLGERLKARLG